VSAAAQDETALSIIKTAVADACVVCRSVQRDIERVRSITKDDRSPVTVADFASQAVIAHQLSLRDPALKLVAEETADALRATPDLLAEVARAVRLVWTDASEADILDAIDLGAGAGGTGAFWTLDPIDGTKGFLRGQQYAISLAHIDNGAPTLGVLGCPNLSADFIRPFDDSDPVGVIYLAAASAGLYQLPANRPATEPTKINRTAYNADLQLRLCESVEKAHSSHDATGRILERLDRGRDPQRLDSQCKYAVVARGQADAYLRMPTKAGYVERIWDHAAGAIVATEAGCLVTDILGKPLDFSFGRGLENNLGVVCAPHPLHGDLVRAIHDLGLDSPATE